MEHTAQGNNDAEVEEGNSLRDDRPQYQNRSLYAEAVRRKIDTAVQLFDRKEKRKQLTNNVPHHTPELPAEYRETYVYLLPVDPVTLYVVWELPSRTIESLKRKRAADLTRCIVRLYEIVVPPYPDAESDTRAHLDIDAHEGTGECFVHVSQPGRYYAEIVLHLSNGEFVRLQRSDSLATPGCPVHHEGLQWRNVV